ncbi:hypothetical protein SDC9_165798 [bioreactor metagenome]|uniref:Uncharacterized protein n=1 Tax=bioreactor metagenome TaxID=1076179 RepID=A0A645FV83_9ZZZZ
MAGTYRCPVQERNRRSFGVAHPERGQAAGEGRFLHIHVPRVEYEAGHRRCGPHTGDDGERCERKHRHRRQHHQQLT